MIFAHEKDNCDLWNEYSTTARIILIMMAKLFLEPACLLSLGLKKYIFCIKFEKIISFALFYWDFVLDKSLSLSKSVLELKWFTPAEVLFLTANT